ncbi:MAG: tyrosine-protein phosphatase [Rhodobacteraceae bacterium]|nr:tyrosine-protein phosphatase [Paracoccaceae bacterium]
MRVFLFAVVIAGLAATIAPTAESADIAHAEVVKRADGAYAVTWTAQGPVDVLLSGDPNAKPAKMTLVSDNDADGQYVATDLGKITRPYFYLRPENGEGVRVALRVLPLEGGRNFRDLGGYPTKDGRHVKWGRVFRSGMMANLTDADYKYLSALGIRVVCDFRSIEERATEPTKWRAKPKIEYMAWDYSDASAGTEDQLRQMFAQPDLTPAKIAAVMAEVYPGIIEQHKDKYREMFDQLADGDIPLAFNCAAGKDRAGTAAALLLTALGVPHDIVVKDYALSEKVVDYDAAFAGDNMSEEEMAKNPYGFLAKLPKELRAPLMRSDPAYIERTFSYLDEQYGGVDRFIRVELDVDDMELARIRAALLE